MRGTPCTDFTPCNIHNTERIRNPSICTGKWSQEEEARMSEARQFCLTKEWDKVQQIVQTRSRNQCVSKWQNICKKEMKTSRANKQRNTAIRILPRPPS